MEIGTGGVRYCLYVVQWAAISQWKFFQLTAAWALLTAVVVIPESCALEMLHTLSDVCGDFERVVMRVTRETALPLQPA